MEPNSSTPPQPAAASASITTTSTLLDRHFCQPTLTQRFIPDHHHYYYSHQNHSFAYPSLPFPVTNAELPGSSSPGNFGLIGDSVPFSQTNSGQLLVQEQERMRTQLDLYTSKVARIKRKMARQRSLGLNRNPTAAQPDARRLNVSGSVSGADARIDLFKFLTPDNKKLRILLKKVLKNSDVGSLGRIVLPKRAAEENLPSLFEKEGIQVVVREVFSNQTWSFKYKFWSNNKSRMYVLENTGEFVKQKQLGMGDSLILYEDESKNLYVSVTRVRQLAAAVTPTNEHYKNHNHHRSCDEHQQSDEEETSLALLIEQVLAGHDEQEEADDLILFPNDDASSSRGSQQSSSPSRNDPFTEPRCLSTAVDAVNASTARPSSVSTYGGKESGVDDRLITFDDCYGGLDTLPDVNRYDFSP